jgi:hypothetical protein
MANQSTVLVTGAAGFMGSHVTAKLVETSYRTLAMRTALLGAPVLVHTINPVWGTMFSLVAIAYFLAGRYRPWLFGARKSLVLPTGTYVVGRGIFYSEIMQHQGEDERSLLLLPPRYRTYGEELHPIYQFPEFRPIVIRRPWRWLMRLLDGHNQPISATA